MIPLAPHENSIQNADPRGRLDVAALRIFKMLVQNRLEPALGKKDLWNKGLGEFIEAGIERIGLPSKPITPRDIFNALFGGPRHR